MWFLLMPFIFISIHYTVSNCQWLATGVNYVNFLIKYHTHGLYDICMYEMFIKNYILMLKFDIGQLFKFGRYGICEERIFSNYVIDVTGSPFFTNVCMGHTNACLGFAVCVWVMCPNPIHNFVLLGSIKFYIYDKKIVFNTACLRHLVLLMMSFFCIFLVFFLYVYSNCILSFFLNRKCEM